MNILLCGPPCSGKTTLGYLLGQKYNRSFLDLDHLVEVRYGQLKGVPHSCRLIHQLEGESRFRRLEEEALTSLSNERGVIIALGGGTLEYGTSRDLARSMGILIYLRVNEELLWKRILKRSPLPSYLDPDDPKGSFQALMKRRKPIFEEWAHCTIDLEEKSMKESFLHGE